jgi:protein-tyrosine phosphatase
VIPARSRLDAGIHVLQRALHDWRRQLAGEPALPALPIRTVAFVCHGNICRSPFAAALLQRSRPDLRVRSFGLAAARDHEADRNALRLAREFGVALDSHRTRPLTAEELRAADLVLVMEAPQLRLVRGRSSRVRRDRVRVLGDFLRAPPHSIRDPWSQPEPIWRSTFQRIERAVARLAALLGQAS